MVGNGGPCRGFWSDQHTVSVYVYIYIVDSMYLTVHTMYSAGNTYPKQHSGLTATLTYHQGDLFVFASHGWIPRYKKNIKKSIEHSKLLLGSKLDRLTVRSQRFRVNLHLLVSRYSSGFKHIAVRHPICSRCWRDNVRCWEHDMRTQDTVFRTWRPDFCQSWSPHFMHACTFAIFCSFERMDLATTSRNQCELLAYLKPCCLHCTLPSDVRRVKKAWE